jgi:hypothetical protein
MHVRQGLEQELLEMAEKLHWPAGVRSYGVKVDDPDIVVAGGSEAAWREWAATADDDDLGSVEDILDTALAMELHIDIGPPDMWLSHHESLTDWRQERWEVVARRRERDARNPAAPEHVVALKLGYGPSASRA